MELGKLSKLVLALGASAALVACGNGGSDDSANNGSEGGDSAETAAVSGPISVISREEGSGTRDAFTEITGVAEDDTDNTVDTATIQNGTDQVITSVSGDPNSIGYISLGSLNDSVKAVKVDGTEATEENVANDEYSLARPFNIVYQGELEGVTKDFHDFIFSKDGQDIALDQGYVPVDSEAEAYEGDGSQSGEINIVGSTSVAPVMEAMAEKYMELNPEVNISITANGSSAGVQAAIDGTAQLGMASRELKEEESSEVTGEAIAKDGIAVVVNTENGVEDLTMDQIKQIFTGEITEWEEVQ
ncbi:substrate-binding domain-containing protein [Aerococcus kribbianus]|uniref:Substrate-binding domain-containing protein n=1 Tax=Aerococcus kribbianus TaxID=2999064 RepID=A0A9X3FSC0_9LACT|nr:MULTISPECIES: substrate-binding domain-containing protein [unclassified Aerococcus]MCZ0717497.1 substrate-binding domain-containing protein [Aerococcus sp. YH-aer221]MCZ0725785.1 substrate-binding domain-containing protein [Aerococcus sp. YH-aer222]